MSWSNLLMSGEPLKSLDVATSCLYKMAFSGTKYATQWCGPPMLMNDSNIWMMVSQRRDVLNGSLNCLLHINPKIYIYKAYHLYIDTNCPLALRAHTILKSSEATLVNHNPLQAHLGQSTTPKIDYQHSPKFDTHESWLLSTTGSVHKTLFHVRVLIEG